MKSENSRKYIAFKSNLPIQMEEFIYSQNFEPSRQLKKWWRSTHKTTIPITGTLIMPGLVQTTSYIWHFIGVVAIAVLEFWAFNTGLKQGMRANWVLVAMIIDVGLAILAHYPQSKICEIKNRIFVESDGGELLRYGNMLSSPKLVIMMK